MTITTAKWTLDDYHLMVEVGLLSKRHGEVSPLAFPDIKISVSRFLNG
jgi:hypothetical protein